MSPQSGAAGAAAAERAMAGILPWIVAGRVLRRAQAVSGPEGRLFDAAVPVLQRLERILPPPIGLSLSAACEVVA